MWWELKFGQRRLDPFDGWKKEKKETKGREGKHIICTVGSTGGDARRADSEGQSPNWEWMIAARSCFSQGGKGREENRGAGEGESSSQRRER